MDDTKLADAEKPLDSMKAEYYKETARLSHMRAQRWKEAAKQVDETIGVRRSIGSAVGNSLVIARESNGRETSQQSQFR